MSDEVEFEDEQADDGGDASGSDTAQTLATATPDADRPPPGDGSIPSRVRPR